MIQQIGLFTHSNTWSHLIIVNIVSYGNDCWIVFINIFVDIMACNTLATYNDCWAPLTSIIYVILTYLGSIVNVGQQEGVQAHLTPFSLPAPCYLHFPFVPIIFQQH